MDAKILSIVDTRDKMTVLDSRGEERIVGIPGTGDARECSVCGRTHEIHVTVDAWDGVRVMGLGCAKKSGFGPYLLFREARDILESLAKGCPEITVLRSGRAAAVRGTDPGFVDSVLTLLRVGNVGYPRNWKTMTKEQKLAWNKVENRMWKMRKESQEVVRKAMSA
jgi:hypothetical protein